MTLRQKVSADLVDLPRIGNVEYNPKAGALKVLGPIMGSLVPKGECSAGLGMERAGATCAFFNNGEEVHFIAFGTAVGMTAPTGPADGVPVPPGQFIVLAFGDKLACKSDTSDVYAYLVEDESYIG